MIILKKRNSVDERAHKVIVIDLAKDPDMDKAKKLVTNMFSERDWLECLEEYTESDFKTRWMVIDGDEFNFYEDYDLILKDYKSFEMFEKQDRSTFKYWFAHWCAFQLTALNLKVWKWKYLLHDFEKPWLKLFWDYKKVQKWHREHSSHHLEYGVIHGFDNVDWMALMIDWECCGLSKKEAQLDARETLEYELEHDWKAYEKIIRPRLEKLLDIYDL